MKPHRVLLTILALAISVNAAPPDNPVSAPEAKPDALTPFDSALPVQVSLQFDWIKLPHLTANQLLRRHLQHSTDGDALYAAVQELIAQKKAERMDLNALVVRGGQRSKVEAIIEKPYPTEFDPPEVSGPVPGGGDPGKEKISPAMPQGFNFRSTGHTAEVEATISEDGRIIDLNLGPEWVEQLTEWSWGTGIGEVKQPVFGTDKLSGQLLCGNGEWELAGLFTPPWLPEAGKPPGCAPLPADRVFLFARATTARKRQENPPAALDGVKQITVLAEWIETDTATASALLAQHPAFGDSTPLREALEPMLTDGRASLLESAALPVRGGQRSKIESITEFPYPTEFDYPVMDQTFPSPQTEQQRAPGVPAVPMAFGTRNLGTTMEIEATVGESGHVIDLNCGPELSFHNGLDSFGQGVSEHKQPRFQTMKTTCQLLVRPGAPAMIAAFDAPVADDKAQPHARSRKVLLFIRAIL